MATIGAVPTRFLDDVASSADEWGLSDRRRLALLLTPFAVPFVYSVALFLGPSRDTAIAMLAENRPVELLTVLFLFAAAALCVPLVRRNRRLDEPVHVPAFFALFGLAMFVVAMEEISWGQWFLGFETPDGIKEINGQDEVNLHNLGGLQDRTEIFRLAFGIGGLVGVWLGRRPVFRAIAPPFFLAPWFVAITGLAVPDTLNDLIGGGGAIGALFDHLSELTEMIIGLAALLYIWFVSRRPVRSTSR